MNITLSRTTNRHIDQTIQPKHPCTIIDILERINEGLLTGITLFDLTKCFDTIDHVHDILMLC